ncbi:unnamed protein product [Ambrosiozyma monospora]|uniref:Unnamed protein product n=1 Tax=Ambrosiozyma monospora TaxID=43982 RepID=A0ACB5SSF3_AMBMO|nr:unnamed protein product [Ambrosiozyma monospora]
MKFSTTLIALVASTVIASPFPDQSLTTLVTVTTSSAPEATASSIQIQDFTNSTNYSNLTDTDAVEKAVSLSGLSNIVGIGSSLVNLFNFAKANWPGQSTSTSS